MDSEVVDNKIGLKNNYRLTIINIYKYNHRTYYKCKCDCGNETNVTSYNFYKTKSCGCLSKELTIQRNKTNVIKNQYTIIDNIVYGTISDNIIFTFDLDDFDKVKQYQWHCDKKGYICTCVNHKALFLHRLIMNNNDSNVVIDHINRDKHNNCKSNLRICSFSDNTLNSKIRIDNTSGYKGVSFNKRYNKWESYITINYKRIHLGKFNTIEEAIQARKNYEIEHELLC